MLSPSLVQQLPSERKKTSSVSSYSSMKKIYARREGKLFVIHSEKRLKNYWHLEATLNNGLICAVSLGFISKSSCLTFFVYFFFLF